MNPSRLGLSALLTILLAGVAAGEPARQASVVLTLRDHRFSPSTFTVPAGVPVHITLTNLDSAIEEFDSDDLLVEERVTPHEKLAFTVGPLKPGVYHFMGEFHAATAQGVVTAVPGG
jgi:hypothetical protein